MLKTNKPNMTKFLEINLDDNLQLINLENISYLKQIDSNTTEFELFSKDDTNTPIKFLIHFNYMNFKLLLEDTNNLAFDFPLIAKKL